MAKTKNNKKKERRAKKQPLRFSNTNKRRLQIVLSVVCVLFVILLARLLWIDIFKGVTYQKKVLNVLNYDMVDTPYKRGDITDRNKTVLATSEKLYNLILDPSVIVEKVPETTVETETETKAETETQTETQKREISKREAVIYALEKYFSIEPSVIEDYFTNQSDSPYIVLRRGLTADDKKPYDEFLALVDEEISEEDTERLEEQEKAAAVGNGIWFEENYKRVYPFSTLACDLIGFTRGDNHGTYGLEGYYDEELCGINGKQYSYLTQDIDLEKNYQEPTNGLTIVSTIDVNIQRIAEKHIQQFMKKTGAKNVAALVMDPNNGEILAMASAPVFDLNHPGDMTVMGYTEKQLSEMTDEEMSIAVQSVWRNFVTNDGFEPGSTVKTMTVAYALDQGLVTQSTALDCDGGQSDANGAFVSCNSYHGLLTLAETLMYSCNDAMMQMASMMGINSFVHMQELFGFGQLTGIDLPGEQAGALYKEDSMYELALMTSSFGQGYTTTMIQVASAFCSVINGGDYYKPHVVAEIQNDAGSTVQTFEKNLLRKTVSKSTSDWIKEALYQTVERGLATDARVPGYKIGGKTGTAEKLPRGGPENLVSFIGMAPIDDPQLVVYVIIDEPHLEDQAQSSLATALAGKIFGEALPYLQIFPTEDIDPDEYAAFQASLAVEEEPETETETAQTETAETSETTETAETSAEQVTSEETTASDETTSDAVSENSEEILPQEDNEENTDASNSEDEGEGSNSEDGSDDLSNDEDEVGSDDE